MTRLLIFEVMKVPAAAMGLKASERAVLVQIVECYNPTRNGNAVWPAITTLAELTGLNVKTARAARAKLHDLGLIKVCRDRGKKDVCVINVDVLRAIAAPYQGPKSSAESYPQKAPNCPNPDANTGSDPYQNWEGSSDRPLPKTVGDPSQNREGTPPKIGTRTTKEQPNNNLGCSPPTEFRDGDHQRKMPFTGLIASALSKVISPTKEQPKGEKQDWRKSRDQARKTAGGRS